MDEGKSVFCACHAVDSTNRDFRVSAEALVGTRSCHRRASHGGLDEPRSQRR
jgi:hypothetical protein